jgi:hypothetical protein
MLSTTTIRSLTCLAALVCAVACAAETTDDGKSNTAPEPAETGGAGTGGTTTSTGGTPSGEGGEAPTGTGGTEPTGPVEPLPVTVTALFAPSGFMGREGTLNETDGIVMDPAGCPSRAEGAVGDCYAVTWTPQELDEMTGESWAGAFFQNPDGNWGEEPGVRIEEGATKITFTAWAEQDDQTVVFLAGGIGNLGTAYADTFKVETEFTISSEPATYELDLVGSQYDQVLGGFGWVLKTDSTTPIKIFIDDVQWVK